MGAVLAYSTEVVTSSGTAVLAAIATATSAGAIVAALLGPGYTAAELQSILLDLDFTISSPLFFLSPFSPPLRFSMCAHIHTTCGPASTATRADLASHDGGRRSRSARLFSQAPAGRRPSDRGDQHGPEIPGCDDAQVVRRRFHRCHDLCFEVAACRANSGPKRLGA